MEYASMNLVRIVLSNRRVVLGHIVLYSLDPNEPSQEVFLKPAFWVEIAKEDPKQVDVLQSVERGIYINAKDIVSIELIPAKLQDRRNG